MNKIRYWKQRYNFCCSLIDNHGTELKRELFSRIFNLSAEVGERIENLQLEDDNDGY